MASWKEQYDRMQRWYERFREIDGGREHARDSDYYKDVIFAFFQNCHHLRDWFSGDPATQSFGEDAEETVRRDSHLVVGAAIANGSKHLVLKTPPPPAASVARQNPKSRTRPYRGQVSSNTCRPCTIRDRACRQDPRRFSARDRMPRSVGHLLAEQRYALRAITDRSTSTALEARTR